MQALYIGIDIAGANNTWMAVLTASTQGLALLSAPQLQSLNAIVSYCEKEPVLAIAIDGQLSMAIAADEDRGLRSSDIQLRSLLPTKYRNWVASINSLMAVPIRSRLLADALAPVVGTIIETHPRASLYFGLGNEEPISSALQRYKDGQTAAAHITMLWQAWTQRFAINTTESSQHDGALDAMVCATIAYLYHHAPGQLLRLNHTASGKMGRGPFYVLAAPSEAEKP